MRFLAGPDPSNCNIAREGCTKSQSPRFPKKLAKRLQNGDLNRSKIEENPLREGTRNFDVNRSPQSGLSGALGLPNGYHNRQKTGPQGTPERLRTPLGTTRASRAPRRPEKLRFLTIFTCFSSPVPYIRVSSSGLKQLKKVKNMKLKMV